MQAQYQQQLDDTSRAQLLAQFSERREYERVDAEYFEMLVNESMRLLPELQEDITEFADRDIEQLGLVEIAVLRIALTEMRSRIDVPFRVVINEAVDLPHRFGAESAHK